MASLTVDLFGIACKCGDSRALGHADKRDPSPTMQY